jgi:PiT family inorganic phosphate transporter
MMALVLNICRKATPAAIDGLFRKGQLFSAALYSLGHGSNDAQKTMGIIYALLIAGGFGSLAHRPDGVGIAWWIIVCCCGAMALGTMSGGWRIVRTMGQKITKLRPVGGFCATGAGAISIFVATFLGAPVSTTHVIAGAIMGVGATSSLSTVRWGIARRIVWSWIITIPAAGLMAALCEWLVRLAALD